jgi:hypothetical protein
LIRAAGNGCMLNLRQHGEKNEYYQNRLIHNFGSLGYAWPTALR